MKNRHHIHHAWLTVGTYAVWFAVLSGLEEMGSGKYWKAVLSLVLGIVTYFVIESRLHGKE